MVSALHAWDVDFWFDAQQMSAGEDLAQRIQDAIRERDIFIRICTAAGQSSYWVRLESAAARGLAAESPAGQRTFINLILNADYQSEPFDHGGVVIDAIRQPPELWQRTLRRTLGVPELAVVPPRAPATPRERSGMLDAVPKRAALASWLAVILLVAAAGVAFALRDASFAFLASQAPTATATPSPSPSPSPSPTPLRAAPLASKATRGMFDLFTIRFPAGWHVDRPGAQGYGMDATHDDAFMQFTLAFPDRAAWSDDQWLEDMLQYVPHTAFTKGKRTIGGITWTSYRSGAQVFPSLTTPETQEILFGRHNGNTFIIELDASAPNFHAYDVMYFTPSLRTFTFT